jgi:GWxTD domain-containing protein
MNAQQALGWALLHFLWQGTAIALLTWVALRLMARPQWRYVATAAAMTAMALAPVFTFLVLWRERLVFNMPLPAASGIGSSGTAMEPGFDWLLWLTRAWLAGAILLSLRSAGGWYLARRRCHQGRGELWGLRGGVPVYESATIDVPQVFGWLRPIVLLPFSAIAGLTPEQLEAVIEHELAHVRRHDYLVNLLQTVVESLLFYHPAVWWVSREMRRERELCCDEAAVARCGDKLVYSKALLLLEESRVDFAMAATGSGLQERIGRLLGMEERKSGLAPLLLVGGALMICGATMWGWQGAPAAQSPASIQAPAATPKPEPAPRAAKPKQAPESVERMEELQRALQSELENLEKRREKLKRQQELSRERAADMVEEKARLEQLRAEREHEAVEQRRFEKIVQEIEAKRQMDAARMQSKEIERRIDWVESMYGKNALATDRGKVYLKFGPPDEIESHPGVSESWRYRQGPTFEFDNAGKLTKKADAI